MRSKRVLLVLLAAILICFTVAAAPNELAFRLIQAEYDHQPIPILTKTEPGLTNDGAYAAQKAYVIMKLAGGDAIAGYKGGLTAAGVQKRFGMSSPVTGVLFASGMLKGSPVLEKNGFGALMLETEIAMELGAPVTETLPDIASLRRIIRTVAPAIEVPDLGFADMKALKAPDLIAANVSARQYIVGTGVAPDSFDLNQVRVVLYQNGTAINSGPGSDALGDQWNAALWLVNSMVEQGYKLEEGNILLTGALGAMLPGKPGKYIADYGSFGRIEFEVR